MRAYDRNQPLIAIHIPKTAGTSARFFFESWFQSGLLHHYPNEALDPPEPHDLHALHSQQAPIVLYGHFSIDRGYGIEKNYPRVLQFTMILRDPFELSISLYHHVRKMYLQGRRKSLGRFSCSLEDFLIKNHSHMFNHFPRKVTPANYKEILEKYFIEVGICEELDLSMLHMAEALGMNHDPALLGRHNATARPGPAPDHLKDLFMENNWLEYEIYNHVKTNLQQRSIPLSSPASP